MSGLTHRVGTLNGPGSPFPRDNAHGKDRKTFGILPLPRARSEAADSYSAAKDGARNKYIKGQQKHLLPAKGAEHLDLRDK